MITSLRIGHAAGLLAIMTLAGAWPSGRTCAQESMEIVGFDEFPEGAIIRDQYMLQGLRIPADPAGGPFLDDGAVLGFLLDTPPGLLSLNPLAAVGGPGKVHSSNGTYVFNFVDPANPAVPSFTDRVELVLVFADAGTYVMTAYDASGEVLGTQTLEQPEYDFFLHRLTLELPGIQRVTLSTPPQPLIGALVDTIVFATPVVLPSRVIEIDVRPGPSRNVINLDRDTLVPVAILSAPGFEPALIDPSKVMFQGASPVGFMLIDRNHDRAKDLIVSFRTSDLVGLTSASTTGHLTAVDADGTSLAGEDTVVVVERDPRPAATRRLPRVLPRTSDMGSY